MGMCPEEMERWGTGSILKESAKLLHKHYRLFLPFFLVFYLPRSIAPLLLSSTPLLNAVNTVQTTSPATSPSGDQSFHKIFIWTLVLLIYVLGTLGTGAVSYITANLYTRTDTEDDRSTVPAVFRFLPHAFLRMSITKLWTVLAVLFLYFLSTLIPAILAVVLTTADWSNPKSIKFFTFFVLFLFLSGTIYLAIVFALAEVVAVLERGNYGRKALKRSTKLARIGRVGTIVGVWLVWIVLYAVLTVLTPGNMTGGIPVWAKIVLGVLMVGLDSVIRLYFGVVSVVMYFVYKARFDAAESARIPVFQRIDSTEHSHDPIVEGKGSVTYIGEP